MNDDRIGLHDLNSIPDRAILEAGPNGRTDTHHDSWTPIDLAELADKPPVQPTLGDLGLIYPGKRHVLSGPQESAKTLAAYIIAIQVTRTGATVIIIDFEMGQWDARDRLRELGTTNHELHRIHYIEPHDPATPTRIQPLVELQPQLVIIDAAAGAYDLQGLDDNKRADVERFTRIYVQTFWRNEIATIVLDHVVKNTDNRGNYAIGSERKVGGTDVHLGFQVNTPISRGGRGSYKLTTHKDRGGHLQRGHIADLELVSHPETHQITWEIKRVEHTDQFRPTVLMERVSQWLQGQDEPATFTKIKESVTGEDAYIAVATECLIREDYASEEPGLRGARLVCHKVLFTGQDLTPASAAVLGSSDVTKSPDSGTTVSSHSSTPATPASPLREGVVSTPAPASIGAGDEGVAEDVTPAAQDIDVFDPAVQAQLGDDDIPF